MSRCLDFADSSPAFNLGENHDLLLHIYIFKYLKTICRPVSCVKLHYASLIIIINYRTTNIL